MSFLQTVINDNIIGQSTAYRSLLIILYSVYYIFHKLSHVIVIIISLLTTTPLLLKVPVLASQTDLKNSPGTEASSAN